MQKTCNSLNPTIRCHIHQRRLKRRKGVYYARKLRRLTDAYARGDLSFEDVDASVQGWINHVRYGNTVGLRKALFRAVPLQAPSSGKERPL